MPTVARWLVPRLTSGLCAASTAFAAPAAVQAAPATPTAVTAAATTATCPALLQQTLPRLQDEKPINLCAYAGRVVLVVNTASQCGYTPQYKALEALHTRLAGRGLTVLGFPSNDFGAQEPGNNAAIASFCEDQFAVRFPMFAKSTVAAPRSAKSATGTSAVNPLYAALAVQTGQSPQWNFHKYLISRDGRSVRSHGSSVEPQDPRFVQEIERLLAEK